MPVFNTPLRYLQEAIESVCNQTYGNFELCVVDDGSSKLECLELVKAFIQKDRRIVCLHKTKNEGSAMSRNAGIEYFVNAGGGDLEARKEGDLCFYKLGLSTLIKHQDHNNACSISHIIFLDSDDVWNPNLLQECLRVAKRGIDIVWFADDKIIEEPNLSFTWTLQSIFQYDKAQIITAKDWLERARELNICEFWFAWQGLINFEFLKAIHLRHIPRVIHEDVYFGIALFFQSDKIYVLPKKLIKYRIRKESISSFAGSVTLEQIPFYLRGIFQAFNGDLILTKNFYKCLSFMLTYFHLRDLIAKHKDNPNIVLLEETFMPFYTQRYLEFLYYLAWNQARAQEIDMETYFTICFNAIFELLEGDKEPFDGLECPNILKDGIREREIRFIKDLLYLQDSHISTLLQENQALKDALAKAQDKIKTLESK